jgi:hypothetical protein
MKFFPKYGVSAIALLAAVSLVHAQTAERQGSEKGGQSQHMQSERGGKEGGAMQHEGRMQQGRTAESERGKGEERSEARREGREKEYGQQGEREMKGHETAKKAPAEEQRESERAQTREREQSQGHRTAKKEPAEEQREKTQREGERKEQGTETRQRESQAGTAGKSEELRHEGERAGARISVNANRKTEIRDVIHRESGLRVYHRSDVHFAVRVGERLPETVVFYDAPPRLIEIVPDFRRYKIVVLDDEILVIDAATREIVDVIPV